MPTSTSTLPLAGPLTIADALSPADRVNARDTAAATAPVACAGKVRWNDPVAPRRTPRPPAGRPWPRLGPGASGPLANAGACRAYGEAADRRPDARLAEEAAATTEQAAP